jgi:5-methylcytosine-specific restriction endonuclease McrA
MHVKHCGRPKPTFNCLVCGTEKNISYQSNNLYCSHTCAQQARKVPMTEERYKRKRAIANEAWQRYHAKQKQQTPADEDISALQEFYANCPKGYEVDHIYPISKGGFHTLPNLQYLNKEDNRRKSDKLNWSR